MKDSISKRMRHPTYRATSGFTLVELLLTMIILSVTASIVLLKVADRYRQAKETALKRNLELLRNAIVSFDVDTGYFPLKLSDLSATAAPAKGYDLSGNQQSVTKSDWHGPYVASIPYDPVSGSALTYSVTSGTVGNVTSSASGNGLDGKAYSAY